MAKYEVYRARAKAKAGATGQSTFTIDVRFLGGLTETQKKGFKAAADRWCTMIVGDLPAMIVDGETIDDILIIAEGKAIDGPGKILGQAGPTDLRPANAGKAAFLPAKGIMRFDTADLAEMETKGTLNDVITHEMGHVIGIGTIWREKNLLKAAGTANPTFIGSGAKKEYGKLRGLAPTEVPVENTGGIGTADSHWRESVFKTELMSGFIANGGNPISRVSVASLEDMGYAVDLTAAEPYSLPDLIALAERGELITHVAPIDHGIVIPTVPTVLPPDSMVP